MSYETWHRCPLPAPDRDAVGAEFAAEFAGGPSRRDFRFSADFVCSTPSSGRSGLGWECLKMTLSGP
jgi:hypothetical protein